MHILHVIDSLSGSGGAERRFAEELRAWPDSGDRHTVLALFEADDLAADVAALQTVTLIRLGLPSSRQSFNWPLAARRVRTLARDADVVHTSLFHADLAGQLGAWLARTPVVSTIPNVPLRAPQGREVPLYRLAALTRRLSRASFRSVSQAAVDGSERHHGIPARLATVVPRGIDVPDAPPPRDRAAFGLPDRPLLIVNVSRQSPQKDQVTILRAVARLRSEGRDVQVVLAGIPGAASAAVAEAAATPELSGAFWDLGFQPEPLRVLAACDIAVRASITEGFAAGIIEAAACRLPVVASDLPAHTEIAGPDRLATFVPVGDIDAFADAIADLIDHPLSEAELERRRLAAGRFSTPAAARGLRDLLERSARPTDIG